MTSGADVRHTTALKWFEVHAGQRMQLMAGYLGGVGFVSAGIGGALSTHLPLVTTTLCVLLILLTVVFYLLDRRTMQLVHIAEEALSESLKEFAPPSGTFFNVIDESRYRRKIWSYRKAFGLLYVATVLFALCGIALAWFLT